ncbi:NADH:ubiquinone reductase (H(+)-translocating) [Trifolium repens]|nr:NADH:ubiquinone reductase (H(+)-translocating) [Trifolium repens]
MAARSSNEIVQRPFNPVLPPIIDLKSQAKLVFKDNVTDAGPESFEFITEKFVDFESLKVNGIDIQSLFYDQQWKNYFEMLNGFVYYDIVKYFWQKATIFDKFNADEELRKMVEKDGSLKGKTRTQLGLRPYRGKEIRSNIMGINVLITQEHIAKILGLDNEGENVDEYGEKSKYIESIKKDLFQPGCANNDFGKAKFMKQNFSFAFKVFLASIITREGGYDTISLPHRHFIWFLYKKVKINLAKLLFDHLCFTISKSRTKSSPMIHHPRLISEIIRQTKLTQIISTKEKLRVFNTAKYDASVLVNMHLKTKEELKSAKSPLEQVYEKYFWCDGFPTISEFDNDEVIKNFLELVRLDSGVSVPRSMVVGVPNWDIFKGPKQITRSKRKPQPIEQDIVEEEQSEERVDDAERITTEETEEVSKEQVAKIAQRKAAQKERRTKKRQDRPVDAEEEQPVRATKRKKTVVSKQKAADTGKDSKPNIDSTASAHPSTQSSPIDYTKPIRMIQPSPQPSSSSSSSSEGTSSDTSTDSSELIEKLDKIQKEQKKKIPVKRTLKKPKINPPAEENITIDTSILDQPTNTTRKSPTILEHLSTHLSGDAFTHSNTASPDHFHFVNTTSNLPSDPPLPEPQIQSPPSSLADIEQEDPPIFTPAQDEVMTHSDHITTKPPTPQPELSTPEPTPEPQTPSSEPIYGSVYKPLTIEELCLPIDFALPILEDLLKAEINVDDDIITIDPFDKIKRIKIIPLKRKRPEPTIPFNRNQPFFNYNSEPNLELLESAINISLRNFKSMEEEVLIFPSDIDAKIRELEEKFSQSLRLLGGYVKRRIEGRGMEALSQIMNAAERSHALRLTFFNHEEECQRLAFLAAVNESMRRSLDEEQAKIAAEMERQRLAEQEAFKLLVDRAVHIAVIETNKIIENQGAAEDFVMNDQNLSEPDSDKGKAPIVASSPPRSPPVLVQGSSSSAIPSVMQEALDVIKNDLRDELRNEMDEFRADIREDMNRSGEATNKKIDAMMELLLKLTQQQPKP